MKVLDHGGEKAEKRVATWSIERRGGSIVPAKASTTIGTRNVFGTPSKFNLRFLLASRTCPNRVDRLYRAYRPPHELQTSSG